MSALSGLQGIADRTADKRPSVGKTVKVIEGRKHLGKVGRVVFHGVDKYARTYHKTDAQLMMQEILGRFGYVVKVVTDDGDTFWIKANQVEVI